MARASRRGDTKHWRDTRRKALDEIDARCKPKDNDMIEPRAVKNLYDLLSRISLHERVYMVEMVSENQIRIHISRPGAMGVDDILLTLSGCE